MQYSIHELAQWYKKQDAPILALRMAKFAFQQRGDMATEILWELDTLGKTLKGSFSRS